MAAPADSEPSLTSSQEAPTAAPAGLGPGHRDVIAGRYRLREFIAEGGMGAVYVAEHALSKKKLALKVVHPYLCRGRQGVERFRREVSAAAEIDHPGIVQVYDAGVDDDGGFFMAMELLEGESLGDLLRRTWPGMATSVRLVEGMLEPLAKAHAKGFIHRDLKPDNIFLAKTSEGTDRVKLLDFGLAREVDKGGPTQTGITFGTPEYMSPEQAISARKVRSPGDVWSVGVMLYELLSGLHPFDGETPNAIMANAIKEPLPPLAQHAPHVPEPLAALIERCLDKEPEMRPQTAGEMLDELRAVLAGLNAAGLPLDETVPSAPSPPTKHGSADSSDIPISSSYLVAQRRAVTEVAPRASVAEPSAGGNRALVIAIWAAVGALLLVGGAIFAFFATRGEPETVVVHVPTPVESAVAATAGQVAASEGAASERTPSEGTPSEGTPPEPRSAEATPSEAAPVATPAEAPVAAAPSEASARRGPRPERRPSARTPAEPAGPSALEEARERLARNDSRGARDVLMRRARSAEELAMLVDLQRSGGQLGPAMDTMERYVRRHPRGRDADEYREFLRNHGR